jgi:hypothetical protein
MIFISSLAARMRWLGMALLLVCGVNAYGADSYSAGKLTMPTLVIGNVTYSNVVVDVASILSGPAGSAPIGTVDTYNPTNGQLTVQAVTLGPNTLYNVIVTVSSLVSVGSVSGADTYDGHTVIATAFTTDNTFSSHVAFTPTGAPTIAGGMPLSLADYLNGAGLNIPVLEYSGHVFTNISVPATQGAAAGSNQTITFTKPVPPPLFIPVGTSVAILATASSGLPVSYWVDTPTICTIVQNTAQEGHAYFSYSAAGGSGSGVLGAAPLGNGAYQANWVTGTDNNGQPLGLALASSVLNPLPSSSMYYTPPYPNFNEANMWAFDDVLYANGGPFMDPSGVLLTASDQKYINPYYVSGIGYQYADSAIFTAQGPPQAMTFSLAVVNGLVGLSDGECVVTAVQAGGGSFSAAAPALLIVDVGEIILP